jgi:SHS2 domain-containing protein
LGRGSNAMEKSYQILEHPADLGIAACGNTLNEAFEAAAEGLVSLMIDLNSVLPEESRSIKLTAGDWEQLLVKWLGEILYLVDGEKFIPMEFKIINLSENALQAEVHGEKLSLEKHLTRMDVKAVTYHQILVNHDLEGGKVRVFLDI